MSPRLAKLLGGVAALAALAIGAAAIADGATSPITTTTTPSSSSQAAEPPAVTTDYSGTGYEVTVTKADGSTVEVRLDGSFNAVQGRGGPHG